MHQQGSHAMIPASGSPPPSQPARGRALATKGGGQAIRGRGQAVRVRGRLRDGGQSGRTQPQFYDFPSRPEAESFDVIITCIVSVFHIDASILFDLGSTNSYMSSYFASYLVVTLDSLNAPVCVSTPVGDSIIIDHVYHSCVITIGSLETIVNLILLDMVDFDVILGMDWLSPYHAIMDGHAKKAYGQDGMSRNLAYVGDLSAEVRSMDPVPVVREFLELFPVDLPRMPLNKDIDLCIDLAPGTQPIFIPPYHMAPVELKELKEQLQDLLDKGFIKTSASP
ncbi:uncharacterized protein [Nicotiana tomentosiformis]|uniref:uncharacterized protein n=1 Tax=Nicotiana tomentosiformis TaxID=4098 RepID=UPI00388C6FE7